MLELDRELFDEFKQVDAICRDMFLCQHGVSAYISQMEQVSSNARRKVPLWDEDYQMLKRTRWLRNQIAHEMAAADCKVSDVEYLEDFHHRLLVQQDPLAVLAKVEREMQRSSCQQSAVTQADIPYTYDHYAPEPTHKRYGSFWGAVVVVALIVLAVLSVLYFFQ